MRITSQFAKVREHTTVAPHVWRIFDSSKILGKRTLASLAWENKCSAASLGFIFLLDDFTRSILCVICLHFARISIMHHYEFERERGISRVSQSCNPEFPNRSGFVNGFNLLTERVNQGFVRTLTQSKQQLFPYHMYITPFSSSRSQLVSLRSCASKFLPEESTSKEIKESWSKVNDGQLGFVHCQSSHQTSTVYIHQMGIKTTSWTFIARTKGAIWDLWSSASRVRAFG